MVAVFIVLGVLSLIGLSEIVWNLIFYFTRSGVKERPVLLIKLEGKSEDVEQKLRNADVLSRLIGSSGCDGLVAVDCGMDTEARDIAYRYAQPRENIVLCTEKGLINLLKNF